MPQDFTQYVHEFTDDHGRTRWAVGRWEERNAQYYRPLDAKERRLTGCFGEFARRPSGMQSFSTRRQALRRARTLFSEEA